MLSQAEATAIYESKEFRRLRKVVIAMDKGECVICKSKGKYTKGIICHHVNHVKQHPDKALDIYYDDNGVQKRNIILVCRSCHESVCHPERMREIKVNQLAIDIPELIE